MARAVFLLVPPAILSMTSAVVLLHWYRRTVDRLMSAPGTPGPDGAIGFASGQVRAVPASLAQSLVRRRRVQVVIAVGIGVLIGVAYARLFMLWNDLEFTGYVYAYFALLFSWPAVPAAWVASDGDRRLCAVLAAAFVAAPVLVAVTGPDTLWTGLRIWLRFNGLATLVVALFLTRSFRAVGVCLLAVWLAAFLGALTLLGEPTNPVWAALDVVTNAEPAPLAAATLGMLVGGAAAWAGFVVLARWYTTGGFSDHMLLLGSLCLVFCLTYVGSIQVADPQLLLVGVALFAVAGLVAVAAYRVAGVRRPPTETGTGGATLLVLRVFGEPRQSARLLDGVSARWRHLGPVNMIGGSDLAKSNVEPDEFLAFTAGHLSRLFVNSPADLRDRIEADERPPDPDGRYRVDEWFCSDDTWRDAVQALLGRSDEVLLDLRGFDAQRRGTLHELELLARTGAFERTVAVVDARTDRALLEAAVAAAGPGRGPRTVEVPPGDIDAVVSALTHG